MDIKNVNKFVVELINNNADITLKQVKDIITESQGEISEEDKKLIEKFYNDCVIVKLSYNNDNTYIKQITPKFSDLVKKLNLDVNDNIVRLNKENSERIESEVENDEDYIPFSKILYKYFAGEQNENVEDFKKNKKAISIVLREIDRDNSTNVWRYKEKRECFERIVDYIVNPINNFFKDLNDGRRDLPDILVMNGGVGLKSFSSKTCKYLCEYVYNNYDKYYINDRYVRHVLPYYLEYYKIDFPLHNGKEIKTSSGFDNLSYAELYDTLKKLNNVNDETRKLTKHELDHILWYCYKSFQT